MAQILSIRDRSCVRRRVIMSRYRACNSLSAITYIVVSGLYTRMAGS